MSEFSDEGVGESDLWPVISISSENCVVQAKIIYARLPLTIVFLPRVNANWSRSRLNSLIVCLGVDNWGVEVESQWNKN
jgi:hypothetical protein